MCVYKDFKVYVIKCQECVSKVSKGCILRFQNWMFLQYQKCVYKVLEMCISKVSNCVIVKYQKCVFQFCKKCVFLGVERVCFYNVIRFCYQGVISLWLWVKNVCVPKVTKCVFYCIRSVISKMSKVGVSTVSGSEALKSVRSVCFKGVRCLYKLSELCV